MIIYCNECENFFEEFEADYRPAEEEDCRPKGEKIMLCPCCGSSELEEANACRRCGKPIAPEADDFCDECAEEINKGLWDIVESIPGDALEAKEAFLDFLERRWF